MTATTIYPRFLGVDGSGDFVWELETGRWTWGEDPHDAAFRRRTFEPERYIEKYGRPIPFVRIEAETGKAVLADPIDRKAESEKDPAELAKMYVAQPPDTQAGRILALAAMERAAKGWADGAAQNEEAMGHRNRKPSDEQPFVLADILNMIDDAAREVGVAPVYSERSERP